MSVITLFSGDFCDKEEIVREINGTIGYSLLKDDDVAASASRLSGMSEKSIRAAFSARPSVFNKFTHEKERAVAWLRLAVAEILSRDDLVIEGFCAHLIPREITHVLKVCLISDMKSRTAKVKKEKGTGEKEAVNIIHGLDEAHAVWVNDLFKLKDPWHQSLYDIVIPTDKTPLKEIVRIISQNLRREVIKPTDSSKKAVSDFMLAAQAEVALAAEGHAVGVSARDGALAITINKHVLMLSRLEEELKSIAGKVPGVKSVETRIGKGYHQSDIYRKCDFEAPKVLLVDDEREFVQTLSERLANRDMGSAVAFDGESALSMISEEEPEVMILDLKMPGIDGIEVLRRVKKDKPEIEVIILTGHGSEADRKVCMELGAFAYLHKPVDIELLSGTLKKAQEKMRQNKPAKK